MKKLVNSLSGSVYWADVDLKDNTMNTKTRIDVTQDAVNCIGEYLRSQELFKQTGAVGHEVLYGGKKCVLALIDNEDHIVVKRETLNEYAKKTDDLLYQIKELSQEVQRCHDIVNDLD